MESDDWPMYDNISSESSELMDLDESVGLPIDTASSEWPPFSEIPLPWTHTHVDEDVTGHHGESPNPEDGMYL